MSYGRDSPSNCLPHHDEYTNETELPRRSLLSGYGERPRPTHGGMRGGTVAARVRSLNAAFSSSVPSLALPMAENKDAKGELRDDVSQDDIRRSNETSLAVRQNLHPLRKKASFRARRQGTLIRTRSNPFMRRDSSAASSTTSLKAGRPHSRNAPIQSPSPFRRLPLDPMNLQEDLPDISDSDLAAAAKGSAKWANLLWNVWTGMKTTLPRQVFIDAVESKMRDHEIEDPTKRLGSRETRSEDDHVAETAAYSRGLFQSNDSPAGQSSTEGSNQLTAANVELMRNGEGPPQQVGLQPHHDWEKDDRREDFLAATHKRSIPQHLSDASHRDRAIPPSESTSSIRSTSPWPDFDDVGYIPSENGDSNNQFTQTTSLSRPATLSNSTAPADRATPQPFADKYSCQPAQPRTELPTSPLNYGDLNKSDSNGVHAYPGTAIAIRLGDMFDAVIIARGEKLLPHPEVVHINSEDQYDRIQDLQQISAGLMQRTKELFAAQPHQNEEGYDETENGAQKTQWQQSQARYDGTQMERGLGHCHRYHRHRHRHQDNYCRPYPYASHRPFSYEDDNEDDGNTERKANEKVMSVPALLRLVDSTAKDLGLVLKSDEGIAPLRPRRSQVRHGYGLPITC